MSTEPCKCACHRDEKLRGVHVCACESVQPPVKPESGWRAGDRVSLCPTGRESDRVTGVVTAINDGPRPGVRVQFDRLVRGGDHCYAAHDELTLVRRG